MIRENFVSVILEFYTNNDDLKQIGKCASYLGKREIIVIIMQNAVNLCFKEISIIVRMIDAHVAQS